MQDVIRITEEEASKNKKIFELQERVKSMESEKAALTDKY